MNRRTFLRRTATVAAVACAAPAPAAPPASRIVDTHTHFYDPSRAEGVPWPAKGTPLYRTVLPRDWQAVAAPLGVTQTVVVEASRWVEDNAWILALAARERSIVGFIGNLAPQEAEFPAQLARFAANPIFRGIRIGAATLTEQADRAEFRRGVALLAEHGLVLELNGPVAAHPAIARLAAAFPALRIMIDHVGGAGDAARLEPEWRDAMRALGRQPRVACKISGLIEQSGASAKWGEAPRDTAYYAPILDHCWECFGEARVVYGSDWPVCEKGGSYADQFRVVSEYFAGKGAEASERYFWRNSREFYGWVERA